LTNQSSWGQRQQVSRGRSEGSAILKRRDDRHPETTYRGVEPASQGVPPALAVAGQHLVLHVRQEQQAAVQVLVVIREIAELRWRR
jgi:hypothetical protein